MAYADLRDLATQFWIWRAAAQPSYGDDIPRIERPAGWAPDWSSGAVATRRTRADGFEAAWRALADESRGWPVEQQVDYRLIGSALARLRWELDIVGGWRRNPNFYVHQTLGAVFEALLQPAPFDAPRQKAIILRLSRIPETLAAARENLSDHAIGPFAQVALRALEDVGPRLRTFGAELEPHLAAAAHGEFKRSIAQAATSLESFAEWLLGRLSQMPLHTAIGRDNYIKFLRRVALVPLSPKEIVAGAQQELERAVTFEAIEEQRNRHVPPIELPRSVAEQIQREVRGEQMLRQFCQEHDLLSFPIWLRHYRNVSLPAYLMPLRGLGVTDDLTSATRLDQDGISYIPEPAADLPYFYLAMARDPRTLIAHEGVHYYQLARAWAHSNPIRRQYYDSGPNEGIGFYAEEMLLQAGLFDDSPHSREIIYNFMRLRAVRVAVDVRLAMGQLSIDGAARELAQRVPMDLATARDEASMFASEPGQAISYQVGKLQILHFLSDARSAQGNAFSLRQFHDELWTNGNVPIALQRWNRLGATDEIDVLDSFVEALPT